MRDGADPDSLGATLIAGRLFGGRPLDRAHVVGIYEAHVAEVRTTCRPSACSCIGSATAGDRSAPTSASRSRIDPTAPQLRRRVRADLARLRGANWREEPVNDRRCQLATGVNQELLKINPFTICAYRYIACVIAAWRPQTLDLAVPRPSRTGSISRSQ